MATNASASAPRPPHPAHAQSSYQSSDSLTEIQLDQVSPLTETHLLSPHSVDYQPHLTLTISTQAAAPTRPLDPHTGQKLVKSLLVLFGTLSIAQFAFAAALFISPLQYSVALQNEDKSKLLTFLFTIANVTTKTADLWLAAAAALVGLWAWQGHLARKGTSLAELEAWGGLLSANLPATILNVALLGVVPVCVLVLVVATMTAGAAGVVKAVTPTPEKVTIERPFNVPSTFVANVNGAGDGCPVDYNSACMDDTEDFVLGAMNLAVNPDYLLSMWGFDVNATAIGIANPGVANAYTAQSHLRLGRHSSVHSWIKTRMCMQGITTHPNCSLVTDTNVSLAIQSPAEAGIPTTPSWRLNYTNSCGEPVTTTTLCCDPTGSMDLSACVDSQGQARLDWVLVGAYAGDFDSNLTCLHYECEINLEQAAAEMNISRKIKTSINPALNPRPCPLFSDPVDITPNLTSQVNAAVRMAAEPNGVLWPVAVAIGSGELDPASFVAEMSGPLFEAVHSVDGYWGITFLDNNLTDEYMDLLNYGGGGPPGYLSTAIETYTVIKLGAGSKAWLAPLFLAIATVLASFAAVFERGLLAFDPSRVGAVAAVALNSRVELGEGEKGELTSAADARRRMWLGEGSKAGRLGLRLEPGAGVGEGRGVAEGDKVVIE